MPDKIHLTVACVIENHGKFLLVNETREGKHVINQPAGHVEPGEDILSAAYRETLEETGWKIELCGFIGFSHHYVSSSGITYYRVSFSAKPLGFDPYAEIDSDIDSAVWMSFAEIEAQRHKLRSPMVLECIERYLENKTFPLEVFLNRL